MLCIKSCIMLCTILYKVKSNKNTSNVRTCLGMINSKMSRVIADKDSEKLYLQKVLKPAYKILEVNKNKSNTAYRNE